MATAAAQNSSSSSPTFPLRDTRTQLFVANLPYRVRWQDLKDLFRRAGTVLRADVSLGPDNRSRGYGTVLLATAEDAGRAVDMFSGYSWQGRVLEVRADRVRDFDQPFANEEVEESMYAPPMGRNLFVGNLPFHVQWQDLKDLFRQAGTIVRADVALGPDGRSRGFGTVVFATEKDARRAVGMFSGCVPFLYFYFLSLPLDSRCSVLSFSRSPASIPATRRLSPGCHIFSQKWSSRTRSLWSKMRSGLLFISAAIPCHGPMSVRPMACRWE
ncbi:hypothetical protein C8R46DRAFT_881778 [Mycena filopes]|nr:hypothetical protein C8R46DRAFT_881778 [Mycena filopes]